MAQGLEEINRKILAQFEISLGETFSRGFIFASHFFKISRGFNFANWLPVDFSREFTLYIRIFSWFIPQLVVCDSRKSYPNFSIFQIALFEYKKPKSTSTNI